MREDAVDDLGVHVRAGDRAEPVQSFRKIGRDAVELRLFLRMRDCVPRLGKRKEMPFVGDRRRRLRRGLCDRFDPPDQRVDPLARPAAYGQRVRDLSSEIASLKKQEISLVAKQASLENQLDHRYSIEEIIKVAKELGFSEDGGRIVYVETEKDSEENDSDETENSEEDPS